MFVRPKTHEQPMFVRPKTHEQPMEKCIEVWVVGMKGHS